MKFSKDETDLKTRRFQWDRMTRVLTRHRSLRRKLFSACFWVLPALMWNWYKTDLQAKRQKIDSNQSCFQCKTWNDETGTKRTRTMVLHDAPSQSNTNQICLGAVFEHGAALAGSSSVYFYYGWMFTKRSLVVVHFKYRSAPWQPCCYSVIINSGWQTAHSPSSHSHCLTLSCLCSVEAQ